MKTGSDANTKNLHDAEKLRERVFDIAINTFEVTCYMFPLEEWEIEEGEDIQKPDPNLRAIVRFDGAATGAMIICPSYELLDAIAANMLGIDEATSAEKEGALCEIANIICGNTVPLFAEDENICYIRPPRMAEIDEDPDLMFKDMHSEHVEILLDEGQIDISVYYKSGE